MPGFVLSVAQMLSHLILTKNTEVDITDEDTEPQVILEKGA